jgi:hypothetical protein
MAWLLLGLIVQQARGAAERLRPLLEAEETWRSRLAALEATQWQVLVAMDRRLQKVRP